MFKNIFIELCNKKGESPSSVCKKVNIAPATFSCWTPESVPRKATLMRIADYFGVSVDYLLGKTEQKEKPSPEGESFEEDVIIVHRDGKTVVRKYTKEQLDAIEAMLNQIGNSES
jgi:transcriptional regulator with XRE-family HTH domain